MREMLPTREQPVHRVRKVCRASGCKGSKEKKEPEASQDSMGSTVRTVETELMDSMGLTASLVQRGRVARLDRTPSEETVRREKGAQREIEAALVLLEVMV